MSFKPFAAALLGAVLLGAGPHQAPLIVYSAPAGIRPTGADRIHPTSAILPNGRVAAPVGESLFVGADPLGVALSPDGRYAIVSNDGNGAATLTSAADGMLVRGYSLAVIDTRTMRLASVYHDPSASFFMGVAAARDPNDASRTVVLASDGGAGVLRVYDLDAGGQLTPEPQTIALPSQGGRHAFPAGIAVAPNGRTAYVVDNLGDAVVPLDLAARTVGRAVPVGDFPFYVAADGSQVLAAGSGLSSYSAVAPPESQPRFGAPAFDASKSSSLTVLALGGANTIGDPEAVPMDPAPDGTQVVGGAVPGAIALSGDGRYAYVALANVDRVAVLDLTGTPRVLRGLDLRLYPGAPYGAEPSAETLSPDSKRLYVALAGLNAVAVLDARKPTRYRYGLIPTAWYPTALALSHDGRYLYVVAGKGVDGWGILQRIDLKHTSLVKATLAALRYNRTPHIAQFDPVIPPLRSSKRSEAIDHVVYVAVGTQTYDAMLGDLKDDSGGVHGNGDASLSRYPENATPNLHALARAYALADNFYASDGDIDLAKEFATAADATLFQQLAAAGGTARAPMDDHGADPEDYGRTGYLFNAFGRAGLTFRDYGGLLRLSGYDGSAYHLDVPALAALDGNVDLAYASWNPKVDDATRAAEFVRDMQRYVQADRMPSFTYVWLPTSADAASVRDGDGALGKIVDYLSHTPHWSSTAIFVVPEGLETPAVDHVNPMRSYAIVISPLARRSYVGDEHLSAASVVKTEEEIFGLPPLTLNDLLASDMSPFFTTAPVPEPYTAR
ncbi:MAG: bifunctional YncE family protein/alkaline phosphatase family protein [Candidatus Eremiobacteraeota bacterium]|nr:bifunctional YncE family protein/alkaline phosphatase family protein [Candidatus Eremiobacteraeota bacterium]